MWNIIIVLIIAMIIFMFNPLKGINFKQSEQETQKTKTEVNQVVEQTQQQVDYARQMQHTEQSNLPQNQ